MANRYANLIGSNKIKDEYTKINTGFDAVQAEMDSVNAELDAHKADTVAHVTQAEHDKLAGIEEGAQVNQNAFSRINDVSATTEEDTVTFQGGTGIAITTDPATKRVIWTATGQAIPGPHATSHITGGTDVIPDAVPNGSSGLMSGADKAKLDKVVSDVGDMSTVPTTSKVVAGAITELFTSVGSGKALVAAAITDKGVPTSPTDTFATMAANIGAIETGLDSFFGDGSDGDFNSTGNVTFSVTPHSGIVVKQYRSFRLNAGHTMTVNNPCRGLVIYVQGDCIIDGIIDMSQKAGLAPNGEPMPIIITKDLDKYYRLSTVLQSLKGGAGGNGGYGGGYNGSTNRQTSIGIGGGGRQNLGGFGGGGSGGSTDSNAGGIGGSISLAELGGGDSIQNSVPFGLSGGSFIAGISAFNGAGATGAARANSGLTGTAGKGGKCNGGGGGGSGAVFSVSSVASSNNGGDGGYAGGFICLIVGGNINVTGTIKANGGNGGNGSASVGVTGGSGTGGGGGGGGAGGGVIAIFHRGNYINTGTIQVNGGTGGSGGAGASPGETGGPGTSGSVGTIHVQQIA